MESSETYDNFPKQSAQAAGEPLRRRARNIDPRSAVCFKGHYGEDLPLDRGETQRQVSSALVWSDGVDCVPDWAMREAWPELSDEWERLQAAAWERHPEHTQSVSDPPEVEAFLLLKPSSEVLIHALYRTLADESGRGIAS